MSHFAFFQCRLDTLYFHCGNSVVMLHLMTLSNGLERTSTVVWWANTLGQPMHWWRHVSELQVPRTSGYLGSPV